MKTYLKHILGAAAPLLLALSTTAYGGTVDLFTEGDQAAIDGTNGTAGVLADGASSSTGTGLSTVLGGQRDIWANCLSGCDGVTALSAVAVTGGQFKFSNGAGVTGEGLVQWDGSDLSTALDVTGLGGFDLTLGGSVNSFLLTTIESDLGWFFRIEAYTDADHWTKITLAATCVDASGPLDPGCVPSPHVSTIPFAAFINSGLCGFTGTSPYVDGVVAIECAAGNQTADLTNLGALQVALNTSDAVAGGSTPRTTNLDLRLDSVETIPEPMTLGLLGIGLFAAGLSRRTGKVVAA
ncbi:PEP-CTERM sorting domain-containing protein [Methylocaldum sp.]|uniref:PEP-CTERM sorting domain-containing protein n=1 Tax=Methylocaldum sp. TaxID=1969727 RepID=UPI002D5D3789|nr:PEP-CTERM sorting domain-containing protein [Methylocaldum sp.]HYE34700.1 PEP-CTERM sorting domain-containing protein [Methylocaldum sp.]